MKFEYTPLLVPVDLCIVGLEECIHRGLPPSWVYTLHVGQGVLTSARGIVRHMVDGTKDNPFVPQLNVVFELEFDYREWCVEALGVSFGCNPG
jgi:hypothetical protein